MVEFVVRKAINQPKKGNANRVNPRIIYTNVKHIISDFPSFIETKLLSNKILLSPLILVKRSVSGYFCKEVLILIFKFLES